MDARADVGSDSVAEFLGLVVVGRCRDGCRRGGRPNEKRGEATEEA